MFLDFEIFRKLVNSRFLRKFNKFKIPQKNKTIQKVNNIKVPFEFSKRRHGDVPYLVADNSKALKILNWKPKRTLKEMCFDGWKWKKNNNYGYLE